MRWPWKRRRVPSKREVEEALEQMEKEGEVEWTGYRYGEKTYRLTEKGLKKAEERKRRRP